MRKRGRPAKSGPGPFDDIFVWAALEARRRRGASRISLRKLARDIERDLRKATGETLSYDRIRRTHRKVESWRALYPELRELTDKYLGLLPNCPLIPRRIKTVGAWRDYKQALEECLAQASQK